MSNKIFIIEPDYNLSSGLSAKLSLNGFFTSVHNGQDSIKDLINNIITHQPDYLILDIIMPEFDGFDVLGKLKNDPFLNKIPVIIYTDSKNIDLREKASNYGVQMVYSKTEIGLDDFVDKVVKIIKNRDKVNNPIII